MSELPDSIFRDSKTLKTIVLPATLRKIGRSCFHNTLLTSITIPESVTEICEQAFYNCRSLENVIFAGDSQLEKIGMYAFAFTNISEFVAPKQLSLIAQGAVCDCEKLTTVKFNDGLEKIGTENYDEYKNKYYGVFENSGVSTVELPGKLKALEYSAFQNC